MFSGHTSRPLLVLCSSTRWAGSSMASSARESHGQKVNPDPKKIAIRISACLPYLFIGWSGNLSNKECRLLLSVRAQHTWDSSGIKAEMPNKTQKARNCTVDQSVQSPVLQIIFNMIYSTKRMAWFELSTFIFWSALQNLDNKVTYCVLVCR